MAQLLNSSPNFLPKLPSCDLFMKECEDPLSALVTLVVANYRKYSRGPYKVNDALQKAEQADESSTERILVEKSQPAWRAYLAAKKTISVDRGHSGKADLTRLLNHLNAQPIHRRRDFADRLASAMENIEVNASTQGAKRRRMCSIQSSNLLLTTTKGIAIEASVQPTAITSNADTRSTDTELSVTEQIPPTC